MNNLPIILLAFCGSMMAACAPVPEPLDNAPLYPIPDSVLHSTVKHYCVNCHNPDKMEANIDLESLLNGTLNDAPYLWQDVAWVIQNQEMPPIDDPEATRPSQEIYKQTSEWLNERLGSGQHSQLILNAYAPEQAMLEHYCLNCHNDKTQKGEVNLTQLIDSNISAHPAMWEQALKKINARQMPPKDRKRPNDEAYTHVINHLAEQLDEHAKDDPKLGKTETFRRLTRIEYKHAIRDLFGLELDVTNLLPSDQESYGFDNTIMSNLSATLLERYISAAQKISAQVVGSQDMQPDGSNYRNPPDHTQEAHVTGLPLGTVGGMLVNHHFPVAGQYRIDVRLSRDRDEKVEGLNEPYQLEILVDNTLKKSIKLEPAAKNYKEYSFDESHLFAEVEVTAGQHEVGVTFPRNATPLLITRRQPFNAAFNLHRHPRITPGIYEVSITGPYKTSKAAASDKFSCTESTADGHRTCAENILSSLAKHAYRREVSKIELSSLMTFYDQAYAQKSYRIALQNGVAAVLVNPNFLFKIENQPADIQQNIYALNDYQLASRLAFFLWNSLPDDTLLSLAEQEQLSQPAVIQNQVQRMLKDPRSQHMVNNFAEQWLHLRNIDSFTPDTRAYPDFDNNLRQAMKQETLLFVNDILLSEQSILNLLDAKYSFINERLAKHYDIPQVYGSRYRKIALPASSNRGGLLRQSSVLAVTSYANRTSPVLRGNWVLENIIGTPTPPPPADIPSLDNASVSENLPVRARLAKHREDPACASCHNLMDPVGFAFENYDAVGQWRDTELGYSVEAKGDLPDGTHFNGVQGLIDGLVARPDLFVSTFTEKLMIFALGRGLDHTDAPTVRAISKKAKDNNYQFSTIVTELVLSPQFRFKPVAEPQMAQVNTTPATPLRAH